jgi:hypothetical protein
MDPSRRERCEVGPIRVVVALGFERAPQTKSFRTLRDKDFDLDPRGQECHLDYHPFFLELSARKSVKTPLR